MNNVRLLTRFLPPIENRFMVSNPVSYIIDVANDHVDSGTVGSQWVRVMEIRNPYGLLM